jgi:ubiquinone/menaquinone biosynthesis C-methylase UbiE
MEAAFDHIAQAYDSHFTTSETGQLLRRQVWQYLEKVMPELSGLEILELNCGTGEDALLFGKRGFNILATDVSEEMLKVTQSKALLHSVQHRVNSRLLDLSNMEDATFDKKFNLIFSNFGGLNCINLESLEKLVNRLPHLLSPGGRFIGVIMPRFCLIETLYFIYKRQLPQAFRRMKKEGVMANLQNSSVRTWYYSPGQLRTLAKKNFVTLRIRPVGIALPPSYGEHYFSTRKRSLRFLEKVENKLNRFSFLSGIADHYIIDFKLR